MPMAVTQSEGRGPDAKSHRAESGNLTGHNRAIAGPSAVG